MTDVLRRLGDLMTAIRRGLAGVLVDETTLSKVDGERGELIVRGHTLGDLAGRVSYEAAVGLLETGEIPLDESEIQERLGLGRRRAWERIGHLGDALHCDGGMDALRGSLGSLPADADPVAATAVFTAAWSRIRRGLEILPPDPSLGHAADLLRMIVGEGSDTAATALETYLVTVMDHGFNASTFAARVVASTGSDTVSAVTAGIGALKGPLHGGAPGPVLDMLDEVADCNPEAWIRAELAAGRRIMGMGHRVYRVRDPRAQVLEEAMTALPSSPRLALAKHVESVAERILAERYPDRALKANVEFYTAILLEAIGLPRWMFASTFACGRVVGWCAHIAEQRREGVLIRPKALYVGAHPVG